jgi:hypothetical protein
MNCAFLTESGFSGKVGSNNQNARTEIAWQIALDAYHFPIVEYENVKNYDCVFIIFPKGTTNLSLDGSNIRKQKSWASTFYSNDIVKILKQNNKKVCVIQEGPSWFFEDFELDDQFNFYNQLAECDIIFSHNETDVNFYKGLFPEKRVETIPTLMILDTIKGVVPSPQNKVIIGGNFAHWYGGFRSYMVADEFVDCEKWTIESHCKRDGEDTIPDLKHLSRSWWTGWMMQLSTFKYAVHLMPTVAAGTFSLNCAYFGIPCIGNIKVDTQRKCFPLTSVDVDDIHNARLLARQLQEDKEFYKAVSRDCKVGYNLEFGLNVWKKKMEKILNE